MVGLTPGLLWGFYWGCATAYATAPFSILPLGPVNLFAILPPVVLARAPGLAVLIGIVAGAIPAAGFACRGIVESLRAVG